MSHSSPALLVDKIRPKDLRSMELHSSTNSLLRRLVEGGDFPHLLLYGPSGSGKRTRVAAILRELFGPGADKVRVENRTLKTPSSSIEVAVTSSSYHIELTPTDLGNKDALLVQQLIKEAAQSPPPIASGRSFKVVVVHEADNLTRQAQAGLRRTMEKYIGVCRLILVAESLGRLIAPVRSRCLCVRLASPTQSEISQVLSNVIQWEGIRQTLPLEEISRSANGDLRRALLMLDAARLGGGMVKPAWESYAAEIGKDILAEQNPKKLLEIRNKLYDLLSVCIPGEEVFRAVLNTLIDSPKVPLAKKNDFISLASKFEHSMKLGTKEIIHLEAFCAKAMAVVRA